MFQQKCSNSKQLEQCSNTKFHPLSPTTLPTREKKEMKIFQTISFVLFFLLVIISTAIIADLIPRDNIGEDRCGRLNEAVAIGPSLVHNDAGCQDYGHPKPSRYLHSEQQDNLDAE